MSSDPEAMARLEKKVDTLLELVGAMAAAKPGLFVLKTPMNTPGQICPLCSAPVVWERAQTPGTTVPHTHLRRSCACRPPDTA